jgi:hypothetical protein
MSAPYPGVYYTNTDTPPFVDRLPYQSMRYEPWTFAQYPSPDHQVRVQWNGQHGYREPLLQSMSPYLGVVTYPENAKPITGYQAPNYPRYPEYPQNIPNQQYPQNYNQQQRPKVVVDVNVNGFPQNSRYPAYPITSSTPDPYLLGYIGMSSLY